MTTLLVLSVFIGRLICSTAQTENQVLRPIKEGRDVGAVISPGALLTAEQYRDLGETLQSASDVKLWVYLAESPILAEYAEYAVPKAPEDTITGDAKARLTEAGMPTDAPFFSIGHSAGGRNAALEILSYPELVDALILLGSKFDHEPATFPVPVASITGDLDGINRMSAVAEIFYSVKRKVEGNNPGFKYRYPVKIIEGTNHMAFTTGPGTDVTDFYDIDAEIEDEQARAIIIEAMSDFVNYCLNKDDDTQSTLDRWFEETSATLEPIISIFLMDEDPKTGSSSWITQAQMEIASLPEESQRNLQVSSVVVDEDALPSVLPYFEYDFENDRLISNTFVTVAYDFFSTGFDPNSPYMLQAKMKSGDSIAEQLGVSVGEYVSCKDVNMKAWDMVISSIPEISKERFLTKNINVIFEEDEVSFLEIDWLYSVVKLDYEAPIATLRIQSTVLWTDLTGDDTGGLQYCNLLAPSRALDFIYTDALRD